MKSRSDNAEICRLAQRRYEAILFDGRHTVRVTAITLETRPLTSLRAHPQICTQ
jgi:hypothetical protein